MQKIEIKNLIGEFIFFAIVIMFLPLPYITIAVYLAIKLISNVSTYQKRQESFTYIKRVAVLLFLTLIFSAFYNYFIS
jgi:hypothetical protein